MKISTNKLGIHGIIIKCSSQIYLEVSEIGYKELRKSGAQAESGLCVKNNSLKIS